MRPEPCPVSPTAPLNATQASSAQADVSQQVRDAQVRAMHEVMPLAQVASIVFGTAMTLVLWHRVNVTDLLAWLALRFVIGGVRTWYSLTCQRNLNRHTDRAYVTMAMADGISWGAIGWWLTPYMNLEVAVVTLSVGATAACLGVIMLHIHSAANWLFVLPILPPNGVYALQRGDDLGLFCFAGFLGLTGVLLFEGTRLNRRSLVTLRLRFESEQAHLAEKRALQRLQLLSDMRNRFVATISHEMRTPLHGMMGMLRLMQQQADQPPNPRNLALMQSSGQHLINVINDLLDFAKLESAGLPISPQPFRLDTMLEDVADTVRVSCEAKGLSLTLKASPSTQVWVMGDETRVRQVLLNLLGNANKFTTTGGIVLDAQRNAQTGLTQVRIQDTGLGIRPEDLERIFEPFHQAEGTYERRFGGTGLGLTISRELCRAMGGGLSCTSQPGQGSTFMCELPLVEVEAPRQALGSSDEPPPPNASPAAPEPMADSQSPHPALVLLVDDNPVNTLVGDAELRALGFNVHTAASALEALEWLSRHSPDLILMDCEMPGMDGVTATQEIRARERQV
ncbi:MAG: hypothetical protein RI907_2335, partial [Pseudomonadota bacterium]